MCLGWAAALRLSRGACGVTAAPGACSPCALSFAGDFWPCPLPRRGGCNNLLFPPSDAVRNRGAGARLPERPPSTSPVLARGAPRSAHRSAEGPPRRFQAPSLLLFSPSLIPTKAPRTSHLLKKKRRWRARELPAPVRPPLPPVGQVGAAVPRPCPAARRAPRLSPPRLFTPRGTGCPLPCPRPLPAPAARRASATAPWRGSPVTSGADPPRPVRRG